MKPPKIQETKDNNLVDCEKRTRDCLTQKPDKKWNIP